MKYIDEPKINAILAQAKTASTGDINAVLDKSRALKRLSLQETAVLLAARKPADIKKIFATALSVKNTIYGQRVVMFAPLYISNVCSNRCLYCAFNAGNHVMPRRRLTIEEIKKETAHLLARGHKRVLVVAAESAASDEVGYYVDAVKAVYAARSGRHYIRRVNINCAPLSVPEFRRLKASGIGTYQIFQETYHSATYRKVHLSGPKSDPDNRITAPDRAFRARLDDVGIGVLYGLYDWRFETLAMLSHVEHLERVFGVGPHTISVPRVEPAQGSAFSRTPPYPVSDADFKKIVAVLRLSVPYTGLILSTRERPSLRDQLFRLGISQISAASSTVPGGYAAASDPDTVAGQFAVCDHRSLDQVMYSLIKKGMVPSFCTACYRSKRTGERFMRLAKPGAIKGMCDMNSLITLREYLDDFATSRTRKAGFALIAQAKGKLGGARQKKLEAFFSHIAAGRRDEYV